MSMSMLLLDRNATLRRARLSSEFSMVKSSIVSSVCAIFSVMRFSSMGADDDLTTFIIASFLISCRLLFMSCCSCSRYSVNCARTRVSCCWRSLTRSSNSTLSRSRTDRSISATMASSRAWG